MKCERCRCISNDFSCNKNCTECTHLNEIGIYVPWKIKKGDIDMSLLWRGIIGCEQRYRQRTLPLNKEANDEWWIEMTSRNTSKAWPIDAEIDITPHAVIFNFVTFPLKGISMKKRRVHFHHIIYSNQYAPVQQKPKPSICTSIQTSIWRWWVSFKSQCVFFAYERLP